MTPETNLQNEFDSIGSEDEYSAAVESATADSSPAIEIDPLDSDAIAELPVSQSLQNDFDNLGLDDAAEQKNADGPIASPKSPLPVAAPDDSGDDSQSTGEESETVDKKDAQTSAEPDAETDKETETPKEDWESDELAPDAEEYINKLPKNERQRARLAEKGSRMQQSFLNPACPPEQWISNAKNKSEFRFNQIAEAILEEKNAVSIETAKSDPVKFLGEIFEKTATGDNSETYQTLLDTMVKTNAEYVAEVLKSSGYALAKADEAGDATNGSTDLTGEDVAKMSDAEIDELESSEAFERLLDVYPEEARALQNILKEARTLRAAKTEAATAQETEAQIKARTEAEAKAEADRAAAEAAQLNQQKQVIETFETVYGENVTSHINKRLDTELGLAVTDKEKESDPTFAFLKEAKKALILAGGLNGTGDFDNDLKAWGEKKPAFEQATKALVTYAQAGERRNAEAAAAQLKPFADAFFQERLKMPEIKMIDEIIQDVAFARQAKNRSRYDFVPDTVGANVLAGGERTLQEEFDAIQ